MKVTDLLKIWKKMIFEDFGALSECNIEFKSGHNFYMLKCEKDLKYSHIIFSGKYFTNISISIKIPDLSYYARIEIPYKELINMYLIEARLAENHEKYLSLINKLMKHFPDYEHVSGLICEGAEGKITFAVSSDDVFILKHIVYKHEGIIHDFLFITGEVIEERYIILNEFGRKVSWKVIKDNNVVEDDTVSLRESPRVFKSLVRFATNLTKYYTGCDYVQDFEDVVRNLVRLIKIENLSVWDAVKILETVYGYHYVFKYDYTYESD